MTTIEVLLSRESSHLKVQDGGKTDRIYTTTLRFFLQQRIQ